MKMLTLTLIAASSIALSSTSAMAENGRSDVNIGDFLTKADVNGDKAITLGEMRNAAIERFNSADTDGNGYLSKAERDSAQDAVRADGIAAQFDKTDTNGDGVLSREEVTSRLSNREGNKAGADRNQDADRSQGRRAALEAKVDTNGDGTIDDGEKAAVKEALKERVGKRTDKTERTENSKRTDRSGASQRVSLDSNNDDLISLAEVDAFVTATFDRFDTNDDGQLSAQDRRRR